MVMGIEIRGSMVSNPVFNRASTWSCLLPLISLMGILKPMSFPHLHSLPSYYRFCFTGFFMGFLYELKCSKRDFAQGVSHHNFREASYNSWLCFCGLGFGAMP